MVFEKLALIPYGTYNGTSRVYKVYMVNYRYNLFLEGYLIYYSKTTQKFILNRNLNELFDYSVINTDDTTKNAIYEKDGAYAIELANNNVEGLPERFIASVNIDFLSLKESLSDTELVSAIKDRLVPMFDASLAMGEYLFSFIFIKYKIELSGTLRPPTIDEFISKTLLEVFNTKDFMKVVSDNQKIVNKIKRLFPTIIPLTINNLASVYSILIEANNQLMDVEELSIEEIEYARRLIKELTLGEAVTLLKRARETEEQDVVLDFSEDKETLRNVFLEALKKMNRITKIILIRNDNTPLEFDIDPLYRDMFLGLISKKGLFFAARDSDLLMIDFIKPLLSYHIKDKQYTTPRMLNKNFEYENLDKSVFAIKLINRRI